MAVGLIPARGPWDYWTMDVTSAATFKKGCAVCIDGGSGKGWTVSEYSGGAPNFLGIAMSNSTDSLPAGKIVVAVPLGPDCTVMADLDVVTASGLSTGFNGGIIKKGNLMSYFSSAASTAAAGRPLISTGKVNSTTSQVECWVAVAAQVSATSQIPV